MPMVMLMIVMPTMMIRMNAMLMVMLMIVMPTMMMMMNDCNADNDDDEEEEEEDDNYGIIMMIVRRKRRRRKMTVMMINKMTLFSWKTTKDKQTMASDITRDCLELVIK